MGSKDAGSNMDHTHKFMELNYGNTYLAIPLERTNSKYNNRINDQHTTSRNTNALCQILSKSDKTVQEFKDRHRHTIHVKHNI
jgi:hypothetical protein